MPVATIRGLYEAHLTVRDLDASIEFYRETLGFPLAHRIPERHVAFLWVPTPEAGMLGLWSTYTSPLKQILHLSFHVSLQELIESVPKLRELGVEPTHFNAPMFEPIVNGWAPQASVFFKDPDGHSIELITPLSGPAHPDLSWMPLSEYVRVTGEKLV
jgi:catechol 2,3-dioxygenase-like lactoylglutathione lyase family enzyme